MLMFKEAWSNNHLVTEHKMTTSSPTCHMTNVGLKEHNVVTVHHTEEQTNLRTQLVR
jgi:hypothetical protein